MPKRTEKVFFSKLNHVSLVRCQVSYVTCQQYQKDRKVEQIKQKKRSALGPEVSSQPESGVSVKIELGGDNMHTRYKKQTYNMQTRQILDSDNFNLYSFYIFLEQGI